MFQILVFVGSCEKTKTQPCDAVSCINGLCNDGHCACDTGYEGSKCQSEIRAKYLGNYIGHESCSITDTATYSISITASTTDIMAIDFWNLWDAGVYTKTYGKIGTDGNIYIPRQTIYSSSTWITGKAMKLNGKLQVSYSIEAYMFGSETDNCVWQQQ